MKRLLLLVLCVVAVSTTKANPISRHEALQKARRFMPSKQFMEGKTRFRAQAVSDTDPFFVFNDEKGDGFVIVSGDDRTEPIIGYSDKGEIDLDNMPDNLRYWLEDYAQQIRSLDQEEAAPSAMTRAGGDKPAIAPLIQTTWNQGLPYNMMTPTYTNDQGEVTHYWTGCVATALAQVMYYHRWPQNCPAIPEYTSATQKIYRPELPATSFKWNLMKLDYKNGETGDSAEAVAKLMAYVGQAVEMDYNVDGSGADVRLDVMANLFSYSKNAYRAYRGDYPTALWEDLVYNELFNNRPVLYDGGSDKSAHQFVCDGYDGNGFFHINWGWGGSSDGFFILSLANPSEKGIGGGAGTAGYAYGQSAIIGFQPGRADEPELPFFCAATNEMKKTTYTRASTDADFENVSTNYSYLSVCYNYTPSTTLEIEVGWALSQDDELKEVIAYKPLTIDCRDLEPGYLNYYSSPDSINFGAGLADGNYKLLQIYRYPGESVWKVASYRHCIYAQIAGKQLSVRGYEFQVSYTVNRINYSGEMAEGSEVKVAVNVTNTSDAMQEAAYFWIKQNGIWRLMGQGIGSYEPGQTGDINFVFSPDTSGTFDVKITTDKQGENVMGTSTITIYAVVKTEYNGLLFACNQGSKQANLLENDYSTYGWKTLEIPTTVNLNGIVYNVTRIDDKAFWNVNSLEKVVLPEGLKYIGDYAFEYCYGLKEIHLPSTLKAIGDRAFYGCSRLENVVSQMTEPCSIDRNVFCVNKWIDDETSVDVFTTATLYVPIGSKSNYVSAPVWSEFQTIYQGDLKETTLYGITYSYATGEDIATITSCDKDFIDGKDLVIPSTINIEGKTYQVKAIGNYVFYQCLMKSITIESGIEEIGDYAFWNVNTLQKVVLPEGLNYIGNCAFEYCSGLKEIHLPSTLKDIGDRAFYCCSRLETVVSLMTEPCAIDRSVFSVDKWIDDETSVYVFTTATLYVPIGLKSLYMSASVWSEFQKIYQGEFMETKIDGISYSYVTGEDFAKIISCEKEFITAKDLVIPSTINVEGKTYQVKEIGDNAFYNVNSLQKMVLPEGLQYIGNYAFEYCYGLKEIHLPSTLKVIGDRAFYSCSRLETVVSLMTEPCAIDRSVFCVNNRNEDVFTTAVLYVPIGSKSNYVLAPVWSEFQTIYQGELRETTLDGITYSYATGEDIATITSCDKDFIDGKDLVIPSTINIESKTYQVKAIGNYVFYQCLMKSITIESGIEEIGDYAFWNVNTLQKVVLPEGLKYIGNCAFEYCFGLKEIHLPSTLKAIGDCAFYGCNRLETVVSLMTEPCAIDRSVFCVNNRIEDVFTTAVLYVPSGTKNNYLTAEVWKEFTTINDNAPSGIHSIEANEKDVRIFDVHGNRLNHPRKGINIIGGRKVLF